MSEDARPDAHRPTQTGMDVLFVLNHGAGSEADVRRRVHDIFKSQPTSQATRRSLQALQQSGLATYDDETREWSTTPLGRDLAMWQNRQEDFCLADRTSATTGWDDDRRVVVESDDPDDDSVRRLLSGGDS